MQNPVPSHYCYHSKPRHHTPCDYFRASPLVSYLYPLDYCQHTRQRKLRGGRGNFNSDVPLLNTASSSPQGKSKGYEGLTRICAMCFSTHPPFFSPSMFSHIFSQTGLRAFQLPVSVILLVGWFSHTFKCMAYILIGVKEPVFSCQSI